jgi:hypothetical protein
MGTLLPKLAEFLKEHGWTRVSVEVIANSGHWVVDERPESVAELTALRERVPLGRPALPADIAAAITFLAGADARCSPTLICWLTAASRPPTVKRSSIDRKASRSPRKC